MKDQIPYRAAGTYVGEMYVEREADRVLMREIRNNQRYPYVVAARQSGKSSLLVHTMQALDPSEFRTALVDLSPYPLDDYTTFWKQFLTEIARHAKFDRTVIDPETPEETFDVWLETISGRIVVFVDEIDALIEARFRDLFFTKIRWFFNARSTNKEYHRIQFVLAGAAAPERLIQDSARSPFNIGIEVKLEDLSLEQVRGLASRLKDAGAEVTETAVAEEIHQFTSGSIFLCQFVLERLYQIAQERPRIGAADVREAADAVVANAANEVHFKNIYGLIGNNERLLKDFVRLSRGDEIGERSRQDLRLFGISDGTTPFRNPIYERVFGGGGRLDLLALAGDVPSTEGAPLEEEKPASSGQSVEWLPPGVVPAYPDEKTRELAERLRVAYERKWALENQSLSTEGVEREIFELHARLREGGRLRPGDALLDTRYVLLVPQHDRNDIEVVFKAWDRIHRTMVALHFDSTPANLQEDLQDVYRQGIDIWKTLNHPGILHLLESDCHDGGFQFYVSEFMGGGTLLEAINRAHSDGKLILPRDIFNIVLRVGDALAQVHECKFIHRGITPSNIFLDANGQGKLAGFIDSIRIDKVRNSRFLGNPLYMPHEQWRSNAELTPRADVYALALVLVRCLSGKMPAFKDIADFIIEGRAKWLAILQELDCRPATKAVIQTAVAFKPADRYPSAGAFCAALRSALKVDNEIDASPVSSDKYVSIANVVNAEMPDGKRKFIETPMIARRISDRHNHFEPSVHMGTQLLTRKSLAILAAIILLLGVVTGLVIWREKIFKSESTNGTSRQ